jgi:hypothetical protein
MGFFALGGPVFAGYTSSTRRLEEAWGSWVGGSAVGVGEVSWVGVGGAWEVEAAGAGDGAFGAKVDSSSNN